VSVQRTTWNVFEVRDGKKEAGRVFVTEDGGLDAFGTGAIVDSLTRKL
jgi:hypothetical protein